eukprot:CAMPEP_0198439374 /NCGR_PEP_ID=MMETSP1452-20131203/54766_1 /TAXON_ID=1181717 /ORGANISM="Synchroma pusillum, Strain CCMP3072" /LENGTH=209 /DNA_ID=CAMNT_0044159981 /DNA_START=11 /DNA_END=637 /DNA_ORIENTATION=-
MVTPSLRVLRAISASPALGDLVRAGAIPALLAILNTSRKRSARRDAAEVLANVAMAGPVYVSALVEHDAMRRLSRGDMRGDEAEACARVVLGICRNTRPKQLAQLLEDGNTVRGLCSRLMHGNASVAAEGMASLVACGEVLSRSSYQANPAAKSVLSHMDDTDLLEELVRRGTVPASRAAARVLEALVDGEALSVAREAIAASTRVMLG